MIGLVTIEIPETNVITAASHSKQMVRWRSTPGFTFAVAQPNTMALPSVSRSYVQKSHSGTHKADQEHSTDQLADTTRTRLPVTLILHKPHMQ